MWCRRIRGSAGASARALSCSIPRTAALPGQRNKLASPQRSPLAARPHRMCSGSWDAGGVVLRTTDRGRQWQRVPFPETVDLTAYYRNIRSQRHRRCGRWPPLRHRRWRRDMDRRALMKNSQGATEARRCHAGEPALRRGYGSPAWHLPPHAVELLSRLTPSISLGTLKLISNPRGTSCKAHVGAAPGPDAPAAGDPTSSLQPPRDPRQANRFDTVRPVRSPYRESATDR